MYNNITCYNNIIINYTILTIFCDSYNDLKIFMYIHVAIQLQSENCGKDVSVIHRFPVCQNSSYLVGTILTKLK